MRRRSRPVPASSPSWPGLVLAGVRAFYLSLVGWLVAWAVAAVVVGGLDPILITSGSMAPGIRAGDVVLTTAPRPDDLAPGTVVTFADPARPARLVTHRVDAILPDGSLRTRGDANAAPDSTPVTVDAVVGEGRLLVPMVGLPLLWVRDGRLPLAIAWLVVTIGALLARDPAPRHAPAPRQTPAPRHDPPPRPVATPAPRLWTASTPFAGTVPRRQHASLARGAAVAAAVALGVAGPATPVRAFTAGTASSGNAWSAATLAAPSGFTATCVDSGQVDLSWTATPSVAVTGYRIDRRRDGESSFTPLATVTGRTVEAYTDTATPFPGSLLSVGTVTVEYRISAEVSGTSWQSATVGASTSGTVVDILGLGLTFSCD